MCAQHRWRFPLVSAGLGTGIWQRASHRWTRSDPARGHFSIFREFLYEGSIDEILMAKLKELNIHDIKQIIDDNLTETVEQPSTKSKRAPDMVPP